MSPLILTREILRLSKSAAATLKNQLISVSQGMYKIFQKLTLTEQLF